MKTKQIILSMIGAVAFLTSATASTMTIDGDAIKNEVNTSANIHAPLPPQNQQLADANELNALVQTFSDHERARIERERAELAHLKAEDLQMTGAESPWSPKGRISPAFRVSHHLLISPLSPSAPARPASE